jgi:type I restriction enzyme S subunit
MSWKEHQLGDIFKITSGGTPNRAKPEYYENGVIPWVKTGDLKDKYVFKFEEFITKHALNESSAKLFPPKTVLLAMYGATIGACSILPVEASTNQACAAFLPVSTCDENYLYYYLVAIKNKLIRAGVGGAQPNISIGIIKNINIPLPTLPIQRRITDILDAADDYRQKTRAVIEKYDQLAQALFLDMFGDPVKNPKGFEVITVRDFVEEVKYGTSAKSNNIGKYPYLRMNNITYNGDMDFSDLKYIDVSDQEKVKYSVQIGDVLFNRTNSKELVGKTGIIESEEEMIIAGYLIRIRVNKTANPYYLWAHLNSNWGKATLTCMCKNIIGMANINAQELQEIKILKAPLNLQNQFAEIIINIKQQKQQLQKSLLQGDKLFNSLLQKAFKGELV